MQFKVTMGAEALAVLPLSGLDMVTFATNWWVQVACCLCSVSGRLPADDNNDECSKTSSLW